MKKFLISKEKEYLLPHIGVPEKYKPKIKIIRITLIILSIIFSGFTFLNWYQGLFLGISILLLLAVIGSVAFLGFSESYAIYVKCKIEGCNNPIYLKDFSLEKTRNKEEFEHKIKDLKPAQLICKNGHTNTYTREDLREVKTDLYYWPEENLEEYNRKKRQKEALKQKLRFIQKFFRRNT